MLLLAAQYIGHSYIGHNHIGHNYIAHNLDDDNEDGDAQCCCWQRKHVRKALLVHDVARVEIEEAKVLIERRSP